MNLAQRGKVFTVRQPKAKSVDFTAGRLDVFLVDGRVLSIPLSWYPLLANASEKHLKNFEFIGPGTGIYWPDIDLALSVEGFLAGNSQVPIKQASDKKKSPLKTVIASEEKTRKAVARVMKTQAGVLKLLEKE